MTNKTIVDAEHIIRDHFHLIDEALADAVSKTVREIAFEIGDAKSKEQIEEIEGAVLFRMRVWSGGKLGAI